MLPHLIKTFHLHVISPYYAYKANYIYDEQLLFRERPFNQSVTVGFRGVNYSPIYGIDVPPMTIEWKTDEDGFRNSHKTDSADIVVLGDSYMEYGQNESDTFPGRLQGKLPGLTVVNLGKSGYGPFQYVETLKRFGLKYKPRYALFAFYEGNDFHDIRSYLRWKSNREMGPGRSMSYIAAQKSFFGRYWLALTTTVRQVNELAFVAVQVALDKNPLIRDKKSDIHPDLALLDLGDGKPHKINLAETSTLLPNVMVEEENRLGLERILHDFKNISLSQQIIPIVLYVPSPAHVYAQFSTEGSGGKWLAIRDREIRTKENAEEAVARLVSAMGIDFISLSPMLEGAASHGRLLYLELDPHWNSEGRELAAAFVANTLKSRYSLSPDKPT
jgi:SGNH hydrolase-like domain, acetyltransferase AlgX